MLRHHSRTSSGSKLGPHHLQITQKDLVLPLKLHLEKPKKSNNIHQPLPRNISAANIGTGTTTTTGTGTFGTTTATTTSTRKHSNSRDHLQGPTTHHHPPKRTLHPKQNGAKPRTDFTLASPGTDEDEWVSTGSGAVSPRRSSDERREEDRSDEEDDDDDDDARTPVEPHPNTSKAKKPPGKAHLTRVSTARPTPYDIDASIRTATTITVPVSPNTPTPTSTEQPDAHSNQNTASPPQPHRDPHPHPHRPRQDLPKRLSVTRPSSTYSVPPHRADTPLRHHPLIRGNSHGLVSYPHKPVPLVPLTVTSDTTAAAQISSSSSSPSRPYSAHPVLGGGGGGGRISTSPPRMTTATDPASPASFSPPTRRTSISSARSASTLPMPTTTTTTTKDHPHQPHYPIHYHLSNTKLIHDRHRTLSTLSSSSSSSSSAAALSSLVHLPTTTASAAAAAAAALRPPCTPPIQLVSYFSPPKPHAHLDVVHPLLPPPYIATHVTVLSHRTPLRESYDRVMKAKLGR